MDFVRSRRDLVRLTDLGDEPDAGGGIVTVELPVSVDRHSPAIQTLLGELNDSACGGDACGGDVGVSPLVLILG